MNPGARTVAALLLSGSGTAAVYLGLFLNLAALGSTLGYTVMIPGLLLLAAATLPLRAVPRTSVHYLGVAALRYLSLPVFVLGAVMLAMSFPLTLNGGGRIDGVGEAVAVTIAGLTAVMWPEVAMLRRRTKDGNA
jgi:hypothetical protein